MNTLKFRQLTVRTADHKRVKDLARKRHESIWRTVRWLLTMGEALQAYREEQERRLR